MIDMGLTAGAKSLWEDQLLFDYTIKVGKREFKVHKVVLASVSEYFRAMLGGSMKESTTDRVELKEVSAEAVSTIIDLIYMGDENLINKNTADLLKCAVYLQIEPAIAACKKKLIADLDEENCLETLSMFMTLGFQDEAETIQNKIKTKWMSVFDNCNLEEESYEVLQVVVGLWKKSELELFQFVKAWVDVDYENREQHLNDLMKQVRFSLMTRKELTKVKKYFIYKKSSRAWKALVDKASTYHGLPIHMKVLDRSEQSRVRGEPTPVMFTNPVSVPMYRIEHLRTMYSLSEDHQWIGHVNEEKEAPQFENDIERIIVVNNFLICCPSSYEGEAEEEEHKWYIFDPRSKSWSVMPSMSYPKYEFALVHHDKHLYALGGFGSTGYTDEVELYSFESNSWSFGTKMPVAASYHRACVLGNAIFMSGGQEDPGLNSDGTRIRTREESTRFDRFNISTQTWEGLPPMLHAKADHHMYAMKICNKDAIVVSDTLGGCNENSVLLYDLATNQWSHCQCISPDLFQAFFNYDLPRMSMGGISTMTVFTYVRGNTVFSVHFEQTGSDPNTPVRISKRWDIPENGGNPTEVTFGPLPLHEDYVCFQGKLFGGLLSMLPQPAT